MALTLCGRLFHNCAPLKQKLRFKKSVRGLGRANLFSLSLSFKDYFSFNFDPSDGRSSHPIVVRRAVALIRSIFHSSLVSFCFFTPNTTNQMQIKLNLDKSTPISQFGSTRLAEHNCTWLHIHCQISAIFLYLRLISPLKL